MEKINFKSRINIGDLDFFQSATEYEITERTKAFIGAYRAAGASYGIVAESNPVGATDSALPLAVTNASLDLKINVNSGMIVTRTGQLAVAETVSDLDLADDSEGVVNLVIAEYKLMDTDKRPSLTSQALIYARQVRDTVVSVITLTQYNNPSQFSSARKENCVVLAAAQTYKDQTGALKLAIDSSREVYSFVRPWFSPVDVEHRSKVGSGQITENNPHGLSFSDLSTGTLTIYQQLVSCGVIIAKDKSTPNVPGCHFEQEFVVTDILTDVGGSVTGVPFAPENVDDSADKIQIVHNDFANKQRVRFNSSGALPSPLLPLTDYFIVNADPNNIQVSLTVGGSPVNLVGQGVGTHRIYCPDTLYLKLLHYPLQIGAIYETACIQNKFAGKILPGKNIVVLSKHDVKANLTIKYFYSKAAEPPVNLFSNVLNFSQPTDTEALITSGREYATILNPTISFESSGPIPKNYRVFLDVNGALIKNPSIVLPTIKLDSFAGPYVFDTTLYGNARISVGLTQAVVGSTIILKLIGKDSLGNVITENLTFGPTGWSDSVVPAIAENPIQHRLAKQVYAQLTSIEVLSRTGDGPTSSIIVYADYSEPLYEALALCDVFWNGFALNAISDVRRVRANFQPQPSLPYDSALHAGLLLNTIDPANYPYTSKTHLLMYEDFMSPKHIDTTCEDADSVQPVATIKLNISQMTAGDSFTVAPGKTVTFVNPLVLGPDFGEVLLTFGDEVTTRAALVATLNNTVFASGVVAVNDTIGLKVDLTATTGNFNYEITKSVTNASALAIDGFKNGFDIELTTMTDRYFDGLNGSQPIPSSEEVRNKYRTTPVSVNAPNLTKILVVGLAAQEMYGVFAKPTYQYTGGYDGGSRPSVWQPKVVATPTALQNVWLLTFPQPVAKVYFEIFGKLKGFAAYAIL